METIVKGTTPTIQWNFKKINVATIATAYMTVKKRGSAETELTKDIASATIDNESNEISWTLTQEDSLKLDVGKTYTIHCDWRIADGTRGAGKTIEVMIISSGKNEVI